MNLWIQRVAALDVGLFETLPSAIGAPDRRSLLAVQRATAARHRHYAYLEIGAHLGGPIQPHLLDARCRRVYSIDPPPPAERVYRPAGQAGAFRDDSAKRMLDLLVCLGGGDPAKAEYYDLDVSEVPTERIRVRPQILYLAGRAGRTAVFADYRFCRQVMAEGATILFSDFRQAHPAILPICAGLAAQGARCLALKLEGDTFGLFFDPGLVRTDAYLSRLARRNRHFLLRFRLAQWLRRRLAAPWRLLRPAAARGSRPGPHAERLPGRLSARHSG